MGDVFVPMRLVGVKVDCSPQHEGPRGHRASKTVVSEAVARRVGICRMGEGT